MGTIIISPMVRAKLSEKHNVSDKEVRECFDNKCGANLIDNREEHASDPPTLWFVAETLKGRLLKVAFIYKDGNFHIRTAYEANETEIAIYEKHGK